MSVLFSLDIGNSNLQRETSFVSSQLNEFCRQLTQLAFIFSHLDFLLTENNSQCSFKVSNIMQEGMCVLPGLISYTNV